MFTFDLIILGLSTTFWYGFFQLPQNLKIVTIIIVILTGLISLFLKANYKIREFNNTKKNTYLLFEGVIFSQIPVFISMDSQNLNFWTQNLNFSILCLVKRKFLNINCQIFQN